MLDERRETIQFLRRTTELLLSSGIPLTERTRAMNVLKLLSSTQTLLSVAGYGRNILMTIPSHVLLFRLRRGPTSDWQAVDNSLLEGFSSRSFALGQRGLINAVLEAIVHEEWNEDGESLRVSEHVRIQFAYLTALRTPPYRRCVTACTRLQNLELL